MATLPSAEDAVNLNFKKVYYKVQTWLENELKTQNWGMKVDNFHIIPISMIQDPASSKLLNISDILWMQNCLYLYHGHANMCGHRKVYLFRNIACST